MRLHFTRQGLELEVQQGALEHNKPGYRKVPGTVLKDGFGRVVYTPPQNPRSIVELMSDLERFINDDETFAADPLIKMAIAHHQFESIHRFYDGNGRTGRIMNVLYLVNKGLLDIPILYLSSHIVQTKRDYYRLLQSVRASKDSAEQWEEWVIYILTAVELTAKHTIATVVGIRGALQQYNIAFAVRSSSTARTSSTTCSCIRTRGSSMCRMILVCRG